jgi:ammonium transporter, Amt family
MDDSHQASDIDSSAPKRRYRYQFSLRSLLAVTALTAWLLGVVGEWAAIVLLIIAWLTVVEVGCTPRANLGNALVRNFFATFVCSLVFGAVGFGLMCGDNPTGWCGTSRFLFDPLINSVEPMDWDDFDYSNPRHRAIWNAVTRQEMFPVGILLCSMGMAIGHRVLLGRAGRMGFVLLWAMVGGLTLPLAACWCCFDHYDTPMGWLKQLGFACPEPGLLLLGGCVVLAGVLILPSRQKAEYCCRGLVSPECHQVLVGLALGFFWIYIMVVGPCVILWETLTGKPIDQESVGVVAGAVVAVLTAGVGSLIWFRRLHLPMIAAGYLASFLAMMIASIGVSGVHPNWQVASMFAVVVSGLVVGTTWMFERFGLEDPAGSVAIFGVGGVCGLLAGPFLPTTAAGATAAAIPKSSLPLQLLGVAVLVTWTMLASGVVFWIIRWRLLLKTGEADAEKEQLAQKHPPTLD